MKKTQEKQQAFEEEFRQILSKAEKELQNIWRREGQIYWSRPNIPKIHPDGFEEKLKGKLADEYVNLLNKTLNQ